MSFGKSLLVEIIEKELPHGTENAIFFCEVTGKDGDSYRIEVYRPRNYTQVYLRRATGVDRWGSPELFSNHDSAWIQDGIGEIFKQIEPEHLEINGYGIEEIEPNHFKSAKWHN